MILKWKMTDDSICPKEKWCDFEVILSNEEVQIERCSFCGKKVVYRKHEKGRIDNTKYLRDHIRHTAQPFGKTREIFIKVYGAKKYKETLELLAKRKAKQSREKIPHQYVKKVGWVDPKTKKTT